MGEVTLTETRKSLSKLLDRVLAGEEFAITRRGKVVARLSAPYSLDATQKAPDAIAGLRASRQGVSIGRMNSRDLVAEGRR